VRIWSQDWKVLNRLVSIVEPPVNNNRCPVSNPRCHTVNIVPDRTTADTYLVEEVQPSIFHAAPSTPEFLPFGQARNLNRQHLVAPPAVARAVPPTPPGSLRPRVVQLESRVEQLEQLESGPSPPPTLPPLYLALEERLGTVEFLVARLGETRRSHGQRRPARTFIAADTDHTRTADHTRTSTTRGW
jgi:hypothetical protein